jgi:DNA-directed RNA polymerase subunit A'
VVLDEDGVSGAYTLTLQETSFSREEAMKYFYEMGLRELPKPDVEGKRYSGKLIFSQLLPKDMNLEYRTKTGRMLKKLAHLPEELKEKMRKDARVVIKEGQLLEGVIDEESLGEVTGKLVDALARNYPPEVIVKFYDLLNRISCDVITREGMTIGLDEYETSDAVRRLKKKVIEEEMEEGKRLVDSYRKGSLELAAGRNLDESFEIKMMQLGARIKDRVEVQIVGEKITEIYGARPRLGTMVMIMSGSRGSVTNLTNILGLWGQAAVREGRPKRGYAGRLITLNQKGDVGVLAGGFIQQNFMEGLEPKEYFYHAMGGRQGEVDTGVSTKVSGYLYRRLANSLKDLVVDYDGTVRTSSKNLVQYVYGEDGVFPQKSIAGKSVVVKDAIAEKK